MKDIAIPDSKNYKKIKFRISKTNHLVIKAKINGTSGEFILDTGASNSCVGFECIATFNLNATHSSTLAAGAGAVGMATQVATQNSLKIGRWSDPDFALVVFDLSHVNSALQQHKAKPVDGIIGADVLIKGRAIIDYANLTLHLKV
ncbi:MAG: clan AA aspartic protease [Flavobacterium sp.]|nr:clan AA aspartic protease [Flavobacterium sp.]